MKYDLENINQPSSTDTKIYQMAKMILASLFILIVLVYLLTNRKSKPISKHKHINQYKPMEQLQHERISVPHQLNRNQSTQSYKFSIDVDYNNQHQSYFNDQEDQVKNFLSGDRPSQYSYSLKQAKQNFLKNLKTKPSENLIYLDQHDLQQRQKRKKDIEAKKKISLLKEINKRQKQKQKIQKKQPQKQKIPNKQVKTSIGEKQLFNGNINISPIDQKDKTKENKGPKIQPIVQPKKSVDFTKVTLNLPSQQTKKQQTQKLDTTSFQLGKKQEKPLFPTIPSNNQSLFSTSTQPSLFTKPAQPLTTMLPKPIEKKEQFKKAQMDIKPLINQNQIPIIPKSQQSTQNPVFPVIQKSLTQPTLSHSLQSTTSKKDYLQMIINFGTKAKEQCQLKKTKINNFGRSISNFKQIYQTALDFVNTINLGDQKQMQALGCVIYDFLLNKTIPVWPKQQGWQMFPPRGKNQTKWKISISTYVLKLNIYRVMGYDNLWLIVFGKLLSLLEFTWKRTQQIKPAKDAYKQLDLVKNGYFGLAKQDDMAPKYFTRLDLVTYFLFCMTTFDPQLVGQYLCQTAGQDVKTLQQIRKYNYKWNYNCFWILVDAIIQNPAKTYFKPILHMNILSSMYLQIRKNKINSSQFEDFDHLRKFILKQAIQYTTPSALQKNKQIQALAEIEQQKRDFRFDGQDFLGQIQTLNFYFKEKQGEYKKATDKKGFEQFQKRCSVFDYFKSQSKIN